MFFKHESSKLSKQQFIIIGEKIFVYLFEEYGTDYLVKYLKLKQYGIFSEFERVLKYVKMKLISLLSATLGSAAQIGGCETTSKHKLLKYFVNSSIGTRIGSSGSLEPSLREIWNLFYIKC